MKAAQLRKEASEANYILSKRDYERYEYSAGACITTNRAKAFVCIWWWRDGDIDEPSGSHSEELSVYEIAEDGMLITAEAIIHQYIEKK